MTSALQAVYRHSPPAVRNLFASVRGYQLQSWRYGPETPRLVEEALERDRWAPARLRSYQEERLARVLHSAATRVPYYRRYWEERRRRGDRSPWEILSHWPVLTKEDVRNAPRAFLAEGADPRRMFRTQTSGSTGTPLVFWHSRSAVRQWYALFEARCRWWNGISRDDRWGILGGQLVAPVDQTRPPFWVWNQAFGQLYLSVYHLSPGWLGCYLDEIERRRLVYLLGYTSALECLAQAALSRRRVVAGLRLILTNAEPVDETQRSLLGRAFACPVRETYGMSENVAGASECEHGRLHLWPEAGIVEIVNSGAARQDGETGDLVCTGLLDEDMPLIRYQVGDRGRLARNHTTCACGRTLPSVEAIEGRSDDVILTPDGRRIGRIDPAFKAEIPVKEIQVIQESLDQLRVVYVTDDPRQSAIEAELVRRLRERVGQMEIETVRVSSVPRGANGKFRAVVSRIRAAQLAAAED